MEESNLRPVERRMRSLASGGMEGSEIAHRFRRSERFVQQVLDLSEHPRRRGYSSTDERGLRPIERRVLRWREQGAELDDLAPRFRRGIPFLRQVEALATYKLRTNRA